MWELGYESKENLIIASDLPMRISHSVRNTRSNLHRITTRRVHVNRTSLCPHHLLARLYGSRVCHSRHLQTKTVKSDTSTRYFVRRQPDTRLRATDKATSLRIFNAAFYPC